LSKAVFLNIFCYTEVVLTNKNVCKTPLLPRSS
jgi:hypothetical protein